MTQIRAKITDRNNLKFTVEVTVPKFLLDFLYSNKTLSISILDKKVSFNDKIEFIEKNPFVPIGWLKKNSENIYFNKNEILELINSPEIEIVNAIEYYREIWILSCRSAIDNACILHKNGVDDILIEKILEPYMWYNIELTLSKHSLIDFIKLYAPKYKYLDFYISSKRSWLDYYKNQNKNLNILKESDIDWIGINENKFEIHLMELAESLYNAYREEIIIY